MGLILPCMARAAGLETELMKPLSTSMSPPKVPPHSGDSVKDEVTRLCAEIQTNQPRTAQAVLRLIRAM